MLTLVALAVAMHLYPSQGQAEEAPKAREKAAKKACATGNFREGVEILAGLYVDTDDVTHVYNQGRCYEQNHQWVGAIDRFREYLRKKRSLTASEKAETEKHIADCEELRAREEAKPAWVPPPPPSPPPPVEPQAAEPRVPRPVNTITEQPGVAPASRGAGLRIGGVVLGSAGIATAAIGLVLNLKANNLAADFNKTHNPATRASQSSYKTGSMVCYGAGAGALLGGIVLYLIGHSMTGQEGNNVSLLPILTPTDLGLGLRRAF
jgi:hypothetical protein